MYTKVQAMIDTLWSSKLEADYAIPFTDECGLIAKASEEDTLAKVIAVCHQLFNKNWEDQSEMAIVRRQAIDEVKETIIKELG